jgi:hypothetical protein
MKTAIIYMNMAKVQSQAIADEWVNGYVMGCVDTEIILKGLA